jgi:hypothetical protein
VAKTDDVQRARLDCLIYYVKPYTRYKFLITEKNVINSRFGDEKFIACFRFWFGVTHGHTT